MLNDCFFSIKSPVSVSTKSLCKITEITIIGKTIIFDLKGWIFIFVNLISASEKEVDIFVFVNLCDLTQKKTNWIWPMQALSGVVGVHKSVLMYNDIFRNVAKFTEISLNTGVQTLSNPWWEQHLHYKTNTTNVITNGICTIKNHPNWIS